MNLTRVMLVASFRACPSNGGEQKVTLHARERRKRDRGGRDSGGKTRCEIPALENSRLNPRITAMSRAELVYRSSPIKRERRTRREMDQLRAELYRILSEEQPMTVRQVFYQAVSRGKR